jgi:branched-chain amino acid transport system substrate-binding protein
LAIIAAVAACSSSKHNSTATSSTSSGSSSSSSAAASAAPIKVGLICNCSGPFGATIAAAGDVGRAWAKSVNAAGGIEGHPVQLTVEDDQSNPGTSATDAQTLINDGVAVIIDDSNFDAAWASTVSTAGVPVVGGNFSATPYLTNPDFYPSGQTNDSITFANVSVAKMAGGTNIGNLYCAEAPQCQQSVPLIAAAGKQLGVPQVYSGAIAATAPNYTAQCVAAQQAKVTALFIGHSSQVIARVGQDCTQQNYTPTYITEGTGFSMLLTTAPGLKDHLWSDYPIRPFWDNTSEVQAMNTAVDAAYPGLRNNAQEWSEYAAQTWTAGLLIEHAVKNSGLSSTGTPTAGAIKKGLDAVSNDNLDGWSPTLNFTAGKPHLVDCWFVARLQGGTPSLVNGGQLSCQNGSSSS